MEKRKRVRIIPEHIRLIKIIQNNFFIDESADEVKKYELSLAHQTMHNIEKSSIKITLSVNILTPDPVAKFLYNFIFQIEDLEDYYSLNEDKVTFNGGFVSTLLSIAYSTLRGVLSEKCNNSVLKNFILPVIDPNKLLGARISDPD